jgi:hypothetical protein
MYVEVMTRTALLVVFGVAAVQKGRHRASFFTFVASLRALGLGSASSIAAYAVVAAEAVVTLSLVVPSTVDLGYVLALALLAVFVAGIARASRSGVPVACRCFGSGSAPLGVRHLIRNALLGGLAVLGLVADDGSLGAGAALAAIGGLAIALILIRWDDLTYLVVPS